SGLVVLDDSSVSEHGAGQKRPIFRPQDGRSVEKSVQVQVFFAALLPQTAPMSAASHREPRVSVSERLPAEGCLRASLRSSARLAVVRVGYLAAATSFDGIVHSV